MNSFTNHLFFNFFTVIFFLFFSKTACSQSVTVYIVDRDDSELKNIETKIISQEEAKTEYSTLVLVHDKYKKEIIGGWGSYHTKYPTKKEIKQIIDNAVIDLYNNRKQIRSTKITLQNAKYDGILGLTWGMDLNDALSHLNTMSLSDVHQADDEHLIILNSVFWNGIKFDVIRLGYMVSNKQKPYLSEIGFTRFCENSQEAKKIRDLISFSLYQDFGKDNISETIDENGFKRYTIYQKISDDIKISRISLFIGQGDKTYGVCLLYNGWTEALESVMNDNSN